MNPQLLTEETLREVHKQKGFPIFEKGDYNLNFGGVRSSERTANRFDDWVYIYFKEYGKWVFRTFPATLDPGSPWLKTPMASGGAAIIAPGFYRGLWQYGPPFYGRACLRQRTPIKMFRDDNRDNVLNLDPATLEEGMVGILFHESYQAAEEPEFVEKSSAGCVVPKRRTDHIYTMNTCLRAINIWGNRISFAVHDESDFKP